MRRKRWIFLGGAALVVVAAFTWRPILTHFFGFRPSGTGGTAVVEQRGVVFRFDGALDDKSGLPKPWKVSEIFGKADCRVVEEVPGEKWLRVVCDKAHYVLWFEAVPFEAKEFPIVEWTWQAVKLPVGGDTRTHKELPLVGNNRNDKALQLMVGFEGDFVLNYVWCSNAPAGFECDEWSPVATVKTRVVDSGGPLPSGKRTHRINVREDFVRRFGQEPTKILGVGISANTNHTGTMGEGLYGPIWAFPADGK